MIENFKFPLDGLTIHQDTEIGVHGLLGVNCASLRLATNGVVSRKRSLKYLVQINPFELARYLFFGEGS